MNAEAGASDPERGRGAFSVLGKTGIRNGTDIGGFVVSPFFRLNLYSGFLSFPLFLERTYMADSVAFYRTDIFSFVASGQSP